MTPSEPSSSTSAAANPCDNPPNWPPAPTPSKNPLASMQWATGLPKDKFGCTRDSGTKFHAGIDIKAPVGTSCFATENATVKDVGTFGELGKCVGISFTKGGKVYGVAYCHLSKIIVSVGDAVTAGAKVGETGITGNAEVDEPHLHLEVQDQAWVAYDNSADRSKHGLNPNGYIPQRRALSELVDFSSSGAGGSAFLMLGPPRSGKSMIAKRIPTIMPMMTFGGGGLKRRKSTFTERSVKTYLVMSTVLETCSFNDVSPLNFLLSKENSLSGLPPAHTRD